MYFSWTAFVLIECPFIRGRLRFLPIKPARNLAVDEQARSYRSSVGLVPRNARVTDGISALPAVGL
jgi:hypothetical protein